jgi:hypothetical protein
MRKAPAALACQALFLCLLVSFAHLSRHDELPTGSGPERQSEKGIHVGSPNRSHRKAIVRGLDFRYFLLDAPEDFERMHSGAFGRSFAFSR